MHLENWRDIKLLRREIFSWTYQHQFVEKLRYLFPLCEEIWSYKEGWSKGANDEFSHDTHNHCVLFSCSKAKIKSNYLFRIPMEVSFKRYKQEILCLKKNDIRESGSFEQITCDYLIVSLTSCYRYLYIESNKLRWNFHLS